jgi:stearoyl-CoA desaturase (delta-9 desaturase)
MSRAQRTMNITAVVLPVVGMVVAMVLLWNELVGPTDIVLLVTLYALTGLGITIGYHRMLTHSGFTAPRPVKIALAALGSMAVQGPVISWVADHRKHHAFADREGDPHSPHVGRAAGLRGTLLGLYDAHVGWLFERQGTAEARRFAPDVLADPDMRMLSRWFPALVLLSLALPFGLGYLLTMSLSGALTGLLWGGFVRIFLVHHVTWSVNSICHFFGRRRFPLRDLSTNVAWLAVPSLGESWHHNHHAFPRSASHGLRWWEIDISGAVIRAMQRLGLAHDVVRVTPEEERERYGTAAAALPR